MALRPNERGFTLVEVLIAIVILTIGLLALQAMLSRGALNVTVGGGQSTATAFARQQVEQLRNQPFNPGPAAGADTPVPGVNRNWTIAPVAGTAAPNRLARITVTVTANQSQGVGSQSITVETMRAE